MTGNTNTNHGNREKLLSQVGFFLPMLWKEVSGG